MRIYGDLAPWFHLLTAPEDYAAEAERYRASILAAVPDARTLLELGSGGGNNASHLSAHFTCTLSDLSPQMLTLSRELNPECEHVLGDMRTLRLGRTFDAVFVHDAVAYMTTEDDLRDCIGDGVRTHAAGRRRPLRAGLHARDVRGRHPTRRPRRRRRALAPLPRVDDRPDPGDTTYEVDYVVSSASRAGAAGRPRPPCRRALPGAHVALPARAGRLRAAVVPATRTTRTSQAVFVDAGRPGPTRRDRPVRPSAIRGRRRRLSRVIGLVAGRRRARGCGGTSRRPSAPVRPATNRS